MKKYLFIIAIIMVMFSCSRDQKAYETAASMNAVADSTTSADSVKIIKTADMRFRVKDVQQCKEKLSANIKTLGGTISEFSITSSIDKTEKVKYSKDSLQEITAYHTEALVIAKIPSEKLDDFINGVAKNAVFVDNQAMKMDDQSIAYLANRLKLQNRVEAIKTINKLATKKNNNVESSLNIKDDYVDKKVENMQIDQHVRFSTITLNFYQDHTVRTLLVGNDNLNDYRPNFFHRLGVNIADGWVYFTEFILFLANLWMLLVFGIIVFFVVRYFKRKKKIVEN